MTPRHGHLYVADLSPRFGTEPGKLRPVVVLQTDLLNEAGHPSTWVVPCTTRCTGPSLLRVALAAAQAGNVEACEIMVDQSRAIDNGRLRGWIGELPPERLRELKEKLRNLGDLG